MTCHRLPVFEGTCQSAVCRLVFLIFFHESYCETPKKVMHIISRLIYETKQLKECVKHFYDKILKT